MNKSVLAATCLAAMSLVAPATAQSLSDAINAALATDCSALVGTTSRFVDVYQVDPNDPALYDFTNGETGVTTTGLPTPELVTDGLGRVFYVQKSNFSPLDPAIVPTLTEAEIIDLFRQPGVQNLQLSRFEAGAFGAGLGEAVQRDYDRCTALTDLCESRFARSGGYFRQRLLKAALASSSVQGGHQSFSFFAAMG